MALAVATADDVSNEATTSAVGTKPTSGTGLTMSVPEGKADVPVARPDFSL
jgi:hypothetical protein